MMGYKPFHFKQFSIAQNGSSHKVGTDGVLLGAWVDVRETDREYLDIGTGSGLIALMLAQRTCPETNIDAVEIQEPDAKLARENIQHSPWPQKINVHEIAVQKFLPEKKYDLIVSNPPYFENSWLPPEKKRAGARHSQLLSFQDLLSTATHLLKKQGRLAVILPHIEGLKFLDLAAGFNLLPLRKTTFRSRINKPVERLLLELAFEIGTETSTEVILYGTGEEWSENYKDLTREFYLRR